MAQFWRETNEGGVRPKHPLVSSYLWEKKRGQIESIRTESPAGRPPALGPEAVLGKCADSLGI